MNAPARIAADLDSEPLARLGRRGERLARSRESLIRDAVHRHVDEQTACLDFIQAGIDDPDGSRVVTHEEMEARFEERLRSIAAE